MPLDKTTYAASIKSALLAAKDEGDPSNFDAAMTTLANAIADAGDVFVKSGLVTTVVVTPDTINGTGTGAVT